MSTVTFFPTNSGGSNSTLATELSTLYGLTGLTPDTSTVDASDFYEDVAANSDLWVKTGVPTGLLSLKGGWWSANNAGGSSIIRPTTVGNIARATEPFGICWAGKFDASAPAAGTLFRGALINSAASSVGFYIGYYGTTFLAGGTKYVAAHFDGATQKYYASTITIDANKHKFYLWSADGTNFYFKVDSEAPIVMNQGSLPSSANYLKPYFDANTAQNQSFDYFVAISGRD